MTFFVKKKNQPIWTSYGTPPADKILYEQLSAYAIFGTWNSDTPQEYKNEIINKNMKFKGFREALLQFFPEYADKVKLWEKLHPQ